MDEPHRAHGIAPGREVLEWRRISFRVQLAFTAEVCDSVEYDAGA